MVAKVNDALDRALDDPTTRKHIQDLGGVIPGKAGRTPEALGKFVAAEVARWNPMLKAAGVTAE